MGKQKRVLSLLCLLTLLVSTKAMAWWNEEWPYRLPITIDTTASGANIQSEVDQATVLVKLHSGNFQDFFLVNQDLSDVRFVAADDKTPLDFQVESADLINQLIYIWVKVPKVAGNLNTERLWMYYGNTSATPALANQPPYADSVAAVYHLNDLQQVAKDSTANAFHIPLPGTIAPQTAMIAGGVKFSGSDGLQTPSMVALADPAATGMSVSLWLKPEKQDSEFTLLAIGDASASLQVRMELDQLMLSTSDNALQSARVGSLKADTWHHIALTFTGQTATLYLDGSPVTTLGGVSIVATPAISVAADLANTGAVTGVIDELRIDARELTAADIKLLLASEGVMGNLLKFQQGEQLGSGGSSSGFWSVIIGSTESSGWTIISLLAAMAAVSWLVMLGKAIYIRSVGKDNGAFLAQYRSQAGDDPALLDQKESEEDQEFEDSPMLQAVFGHHDHFQSSPIYRVYHRAIQEVHGRMGSSVGARAAGLSPSSINAIKAAVDAQMIREAQRLNSKMVLLTIAISGGPFLGLMGTVVGVMITFAAIAATGDVNISAIAPGVAAALLTTVAGLVVAIPALFGYNYLASRIKECISDMRVFADEFVTRLAEYYGN